MPGGATGRVELAGNVDNGGSRPLVAAGTIAELVGPPEDLRRDTYQLAAVLIRRDPSSGARVFEVVNLARELRERPSRALQSEDRLFLMSRADIDFMNGAAVREIVRRRPARQAGRSRQAALYVLLDAGLRGGGHSGVDAG